MSAQTIRALVVDDQDNVRQAVAELLAESGAISVLGQATNGAEAVDMVAVDRPDVVLMDLRMPVMDGVEATRRITASAKSPVVLVHSAYGDESLVLDALQAGARGYVLKGSAASDLVQAISHVAAGHSHISDEIARAVVDRLVRSLSVERETRIASQEAADELARLLERQHRFAAQAAHELRTPLTVMLGNLDVLIEEDLDDADARSITRGARDGAQRLLDCVENLEVTASAGAIVLTICPVALRTAVEVACRQLGACSAVRNEVAVEIFVDADPVRLVQVLKNVLQNAIYVSPPGAPVVVRCSPRDGEICTEVVDRGPGFEPEVAQDAFEPYVQRADPAAGLGIGLSVVAALVGRMRGEVSALNNPDGGATVMISLPKAVT